MKIYFSAAISQQDKFGHIYQAIIKTLQDLGHQVQHQHITNTTMDLIRSESEDDKVAYYKSVIKWIVAADVVVMEASFPSTPNIGHEITLALEKGKPTVVLYQEGRDSLFLDGLMSDKLLLVEYTTDNLAETVRESVEFAKNQADTRFNFFISSRHQHYLDWIARHQRLPRSVYLRNLIKQDMAVNPDYLQS